MARTVVTIGNFDGVHVGHAALVTRAGEVARESEPRAEVVALAFDPHPATVLRSGGAGGGGVPARLTSFAHRAALLRSLGADRVVRLEPTPELLGLSPEAFVQDLVERHRPVAIVEGPDFRFGRGRGGGVETLRDLGARHGFAVHVVEPVTVALTDQSVVAASSSMARWLIEGGRVADAALVLGRVYELVGEVVRGDRRGREIGFPTANLRTDSLLPGDGVYAGVAEVEDGRRWAAAVHVGPRPMFGAPARTVEAHLLGLEQLPGGGGGRASSPPGERPAGSPPPAARPTPGAVEIAGLPEYGWTLRLGLVAWLRDQASFGSVAELIEQIGRDCERARAAARRWHERSEVHEGVACL